MQSYEVQGRNGYTYFIQATDEDAERLGLVSPKKAKPENKKATPENKEVTEEAPKKAPAKRPGAARRSTK